MFILLFLIATLFKFLLIPAYRSTDFEVHRNWLAITHSLPLSKWYFDTTSEWTLDYPPFFAYFEYILSHYAKLADEEMVRVNNLKYASDATIHFQRLSVIMTDMIYAIGVKRCTEVIASKTYHRLILSCLLVTNVGLFFLDHIHFQYNGLLFGILLFSISNMFRENYLQSALYFTILLNMKHIFIYMSPAYGIYLLKFYCIRSKCFVNSFMKLALIFLGVTLLSFGPFYDHIPQVLSRLFPFKRGLCHAYWAPNFWAIYNIVDKALALIFNIKNDSSTGNTGGLVQEFSHNVLPSITPIVTFVLTGVAMLPCIFKLLSIKYNRNTTPQYFIRAITICAGTSFMFGWHVHEKAILMVLIPLSLLSTVDTKDAAMTIFLTIIGNYSLFPLLFKSELLFIKLSFFILYTSLNIYFLYQIHGDKKLKITFYERLYLFGLIIPFIYEYILQYVLQFDKNLPFLPLLLMSVYCSIGVTYFWLKYYIQFLLSTK